MQFQASQKHKNASNLYFPSPKINETLQAFYLAHIEAMICLGSQKFLPGGLWWSPGP